MNPRLLCGDPVQRTAKIRIYFKIPGGRPFRRRVGSILGVTRETSKVPTGELILSVTYAIRQRGGWLFQKALGFV
jgi:hypothetical protein